MKILLMLFLAIILQPQAMNFEDSIYDFPFEDIDGNPTSLSEYKGKVLLILNVASKCGYTPQYEGLQAIYEKYQDKGLVIVGFPANNFKGQEPGSEEEIKEFCTLNYGVTFPMSSKVSVIGEDQAPLFEYLTSLSNPDFTGDIKWNFEKFLVDRDGNLQRRFRSATKPESKELTEAIEQLL